MSEKCWRCAGTGRIYAERTSRLQYPAEEECPNCYGKGETGRCANCGEDEIDGGACKNCGHKE